MIKLLFLIAFSWTANAQSVQTDSLGVETINGKTFVIHKVAEKETLFGISRRYKTTVDAILQHNAGAGDGLEIGQILKVPYVAKTEKRQVDGAVHTVAAGETLYSISRTYQVSTDDIKSWNNLSGNALSVGQTLVIKKSNARPTVVSQPVEREKPAAISRKGYHTVQPRETLFSIARQYEISVDDLKAWNHLEGNALSIGQTLFVAEPEKGQSVASVKETPAQQRTVTTTPPVETRPEEKQSPEPVKSNPVVKNTPPASAPEARGQSAESIRISESLKNGDEIIEGGVAELIEGTEGNRKYLALHRTAPMGTILKVRNEMNNREVFVRVMGKLPDTALTDKLIIRISKSAYDRLGAIDPRFRVEVTYYK